MLSNTEIYLIGLGFFLAILGAFFYFRKVSNSNKMLLKAKQANLKDFIDGNFFDMSQLNDFLINYGFQKNDDFFSIYDNDIEKFRVANALKPGTLNEDTQTQALLLATDLAAQENATDSVEDLLRFATKFCEKIYANICDSDRQPLSAESIKDLKMRASRYLLNDEESS